MSNLLYVCFTRTFLCENLQQLCCSGGVVGDFIHKRIQIPVVKDKILCDEDTVAY